MSKLGLAVQGVDEVFHYDYRRNPACARTSLAFGLLFMICCGNLAGLFHGIRFDSPDLTAKLNDFAVRIFRILMHSLGLGVEIGGFAHQTIDFFLEV
jgi:hypothetical protein